MAQIQATLKKKSFCSHCRCKKPAVVETLLERPICYPCLMKRIRGLEALYTELVQMRAVLEVHLGKEKQD